MTSTDTQKLPWFSLHTPASIEGLTTTAHVKMRPLLKMFQRISTEDSSPVKVRVTEHRITHRWFLQLLHTGQRFLLDAVLNAPLLHPEIPQRHEGLLGLLPSLLVAEERIPARRRNKN